MKIRQAAILAAVTLCGCTAVASEQTTFSNAYFASPVFQEGPIDSWGGYAVDFSTGDVTGSGSPNVVAAAPGLQAGRN